MIYLINLDKFTKPLRPVISSDYVVGKSNQFHPEGLFSEIVFGPKESPERKITYSFIDLHCRVLHPSLVKVLSRINNKAILAIERSASFNLTTPGILKEDKNGDINGISHVISNFEKILAREETDRTRIDMKNMLLSYYKKGLVFIDKCLVIPAFYRDAAVDEVHGGLRILPINEYYTRIIRQSIQLQSMSLSEGPMFEILSAKMQSLVNELYDFMIQKVSKKQGLVRQNILGKRADFTGGAVITGGADKIRIDEIGVPFKILVKIYEPFILYDLYTSGNVKKERLAQLLEDFNKTTLSIPSLRSLLTSVQKGHKIPNDLIELLRASVNRAIENKVVIAKRDPVLHAESVQAFKPILVEGDTIQISVAKCGGYNADFDGDRMSLFVPITKEAIQEAREKMLTSKSKDSMTAINDDFSKDVIIGIYALTQDTSSKRAPLAIRSDDQLDKLDPLDKIKYDGEVTTVGRILFNRILPNKKYHINKSMAKSDIKQLVSKIHSDYAETEKNKYVDFCDDLVKLGMKYFTIMAPSFTLDDLEVPKKVLKGKDKLKGATPEEAHEISQNMQEKLQEYVESKNTNIGLIGKAGGLKGGYGQARQIVASKGLVQNPEGGVSAIESSYGDGLSTKEFFDSGFGSRQGIIDRVINTSDTGYLSRQLVYALQRVEADPRIRDCGTKRFFTIKVTNDIAKRLLGRNVINKDGNIVPFNQKTHLGKVIHLRSPLYCLTNHICRTCYGELLLRNKTRYVGILAGQICGERLTQTIMRTFHIGGAVSIKTIDIIKEISRIMSDSDKHYLNKNFKQDGSKLLSLVNGEIIIQPGDYKNPKKDIHVTQDKIMLSYAYFTVKYLGYSIEVTIDNKIEIDLKDKKFEEKEHHIKIDFIKDSAVFDCVSTSDVFSEKVKIIESLLSGRTPYRNSEHFCMKIYDLYIGLNTDADMIHFEILASNLLRDSGNPSYPARLNKNYNAIVRPIKSLPGYESWLQSFAFVDPKGSISTGLLYDRPTDETILEKLITGKF